MTGTTAIILKEIGMGESEQKISRLLRFFGIECRVATVEELFSLPAEKCSGPIRILGAANGFLALLKSLDLQPDKRDWLKARLHSAFCFVDKNSADVVNLASSLSGEPKARLIPGTESSALWMVSDTEKDFAGVFTGLSVAPVNNTSARPCQIQGLDTAAIIANSEGAIFLRLTLADRPFFLSMADVIDLNASLPTRDFDIRPHFLVSVPVVLYVKWAFAETCWQPPETTACLVIDDPLLKPQYGHLNYERLLGLMERLDFSTNIAFIPWNWNRNAQRTVRLFHENPKRFSLSIHGCDHTAGEYGSTNRDRLAGKSRQSLQRMARHCRQTGLPHDKVMVFPQGVFSEAAMAALKHSEFIATVNSEVISADPQPRAVTIGDYWDVAVMNYSDYPIYTRRYPWAGVENFAFDILLGKPCIVVIHHNDCHDDYRCLTDCMERLNRLNVKLRWTNLTEVISRSFRQREVSPDVIEVEVYGSEARVENHSDVAKLYRFSKRESDAAAVTGITIEAQPVTWSFADNHIRFEVQLKAGETKTCKIHFQQIPAAEMAGEGVVYGAKVRLRRYLCEVRDNYFPQKIFSK